MQEEKVVEQTVLGEAMIGEPLVNEHAIAAPIAVPEVDVAPSFFVEDNDRLRVEVDLVYDKSNGRIVSVSKHGLGIEYAQLPVYGVKCEWFEFSVPNYSQMSDYKQRAIVRYEKDEAVVDEYTLRNYLIVWHLKDWSVVGKDGKKVELKFDPSGTLTDETIKMVYRGNQAVLDCALKQLHKLLAL